MRIGVHFNGQNEGIAASLRALLPDAEVINYHSAIELSEPEQAVRAARLNACDHVITSHADARHGLLSMDALKRSARRCHVLPGFGFAGYHPDMCYVCANGQMVDSVTGGYHSRIAVIGHLAGWDARDTAALYNSLVFARLGYFAAFEEQVALLCALWARDGIDAAPLIRAWAALGCFAHTINHPKMIVLLDIARIACARMGLVPACPDIDPAILPDRLGRGAMHPVFPEIAAALGIAPEGAFSAGYDNDAPVQFTSVQFAADCFARYADLPPEALLATPGVAEAMAALDVRVRSKPRRMLGGAMVLMTHHGTLLRQGPMRGQVSHAGLAVPDWEAPYLRVDCARLPARQTAPGVAGAEIVASEDGRGVTIRQSGAFLCAEPHASEAAFIRAVAAEWEHFLPLHDADLALLARLATGDWLIEETQAIVWREHIAIEPGPVLRFGRWRIDLTRHLPQAEQDAARLVLDGVASLVREQAAAARAPPALPEPGRVLGLVGTPVFVPPPIVADGADLSWMRRSAAAAQALDGAPQSTQAVLRREVDPAVTTPSGRAAGLEVRFCGLDVRSAVGWADAAVRLHVLAAVAPPDAVFLVPDDVPPEAPPAWRALGFGGLTFRTMEAGRARADLLWLANASIAELPAEALAGCRARIGTQAGAGRRLFWREGVTSAVSALLAEHGLESVDAAGLPVIAGVALAAHTDLIVARTGQVPLVFCRPGTRIIELCDQAGFVQDDWMLSAKLGLRHAILPCISEGGLLVPDAARLVRLLAMMADLP